MSRPTQPNTGGIPNNTIVKKYTELCWSYCAHLSYMYLSELSMKNVSLVMVSRCPDRPIKVGQIVSF